MWTKSTKCSGVQANLRLSQPGQANRRGVRSGISFPRLPPVTIDVTAAVGVQHDRRSKASIQRLHKRMLVARTGGILEVAMAQFGHNRPVVTAP